MINDFFPLSVSSLLASRDSPVVGAGIAVKHGSGVIEDETTKEARKTSRYAH